MKRAVFASGKGGTGKTTLTALVARHLSHEMTLVLADCDVEAANLPIALDARTIACEPFTGGSVAVIDPGACRGCSACVRVCRFGAIGPSHAFPRVRALEVDRWACEGCRACVPSCPTGAIAMVSARAGEVCSAQSGVGRLAFGRLAPGEDLSGKLVTEVRGQAEAIAMADGAQLMLIDGPPGVGCPATAAITNTDLLVAVTEPTVSGEHDLSRLLVLARHLRVPAGVVLNKADLSAVGAGRIRALARSGDLEMIAEVPYDPAIAGATGERAPAPDQAAALRAIANVAARIAELVV